MGGEAPCSCPPSPPPPLFRPLRLAAWQDDLLQVAARSNLFWDDDHSIRFRVRTKWDAGRAGLCKPVQPEQPLWGLLCGRCKVPRGVGSRQVKHKGGSNLASSGSDLLCKGFNSGCTAIYNDNSNSIKRHNNNKRRINNNSSRNNDNNNHNYNNEKLNWSPDQIKKYAVCQIYQGINIQK